MDERGRSGGDAATARDVVDALAQDSGHGLAGLTLSTLISRTGVSRVNLLEALNALMASGDVEELSGGRYALTDGAGSPATGAVPVYTAGQHRLITEEEQAAFSPSPAGTNSPASNDGFPRRLGRWVGASPRTRSWVLAIPMLAVIAVVMASASDSNGDSPATPTGRSVYEEAQATYPEWFACNGVVYGAAVSESPVDTQIQGQPPSIYAAAVLVNDRYNISGDEESALAESQVLCSLSADAPEDTVDSALGQLGVTRERWEALRSTAATRSLNIDDYSSLLGG